jgi:hypothetical protein
MNVSRVPWVATHPNGTRETLAKLDRTLTIKPRFVLGACQNYLEAPSELTI